MNQLPANGLSQSRLFWLLFNSMALSVMAYVFVYIVSGFSTLYIAWDMDVPGRLFTRHIEFEVPHDSPLWTTDTIVSVFLASPFSCLFIGLISLAVYQLIRRVSVSVLLFLIWMFLHSFNLSFGLISEDLLLGEGIARVADAFGFDLAIVTLAIGFSTYILIRSGMFAGKLFFNHLHEPLSDSFSKRLKLWFWTFFLPWLGSSLLFLLRDFAGITPKYLVLSAFLFLAISPIPFVKSDKISSTICMLPSDRRMILNLALGLVFFMLYHLWLRQGILLVP